MELSPLYKKQTNNKTFFLHILLCLKKCFLKIIISLLKQNIFTYFNHLLFILVIRFYPVTFTNNWEGERLKEIDISSEHVQIVHHLKRQSLPTTYRLTVYCTGTHLQSFKSALYTTFLRDYTVQRLITEI
jgi:hypothetical protein